jgi:hypothetical protein
MSKQVTNNLSEWGYQFTSPEANGYTHDISIHIGSIRLGATPTGFSFSAGNSDPRALDFQKATTYPLTCSLIPKGQTEQRAELVMEVMATEYKGSEMISVPKEKMISRLTDDISTTCFNLLSSLNVRTVYNKPNPNVIKHTWIPKIRVEIENIPDDTANKLNNARANEPRKRMIIHNQGTPVIFKFGHDR